MCRWMVVLAVACLAVCVGLGVAWADQGTPTPADPATTGDKPAAAAADEATASAEEAPEIEVEVIGKKWGEEAIPSLHPSPGDVISVIPHEEIEALGKKTIADTVEFLPGVQITTQGRKIEKTILVRGTFVPTVLLDGAQISASSTGFKSGFANRALYSIPISAVERIEVIRSNSSLIYGPEALAGGVINIITKSGHGPASLVTRGEFGSYGNWRYSVGGFDGTDKGGIAVVLERETGGSCNPFGFRRLAHAFLKSDSVLDNGDTVKLIHLENDGRRSLDTWTNEFGEETGMGLSYWTFDPWREYYTTLAYSHRPTSDSGLDALFWVRNRRYRQLNFDGPVSPKPGKDTIINDAWDDTLGGTLFMRKTLGGHFFRLGYEWWRLNGREQNTTIDATTLLPTAAAATSTDNQLPSYILQDDWTLSSRTRLTWGFRYERPPDRDDALVYSLGLERNLSPKTMFYARFGTGVSYPTVQQLATNPALEDTKSANWDVGFDHSFRANLTGRLGWFRTSIENDTVSYLKTGGNATNSKDYLSAQADTTTTGVEAEMQGLLRTDLRWFANYTWMSRDVTNTPLIEGRPLGVQLPPHNMVNGGLRWRPNERTEVAFTHRVVGSYRATSGYFGGTVAIEAYQVASLTVSRDLAPNLKLNAGIDNLFDEDYQTLPGFPMPGRNYFIGLTHTSPIR
jgi:outer membrane receptor for ferrienterochelin and colicin